MPIDPSIALQVRPAQIESPLDALGKALQVRQGIAQQALIPGQIAAQQQQLQATQLENQTRQNQLDEYNGFKAALQKNNGDFDATIKNNAGDFPTLAPKLQESRVNINKTIADTAKLKADADESTHKLVTAKLSEVDQALQGLNALPPEQRPAQFQAIKAQLTATGHDVSSLGDTYDPQQVANVHAQILDATQKVAEAKEARDAANAKATADKLKADALTAQQKASGTEPIQPADAAKLAGEAAGRAETGRHNTVEEKQGAGRLSIEQQAQALRNKTFNATLGSGLDANGQPVSPDALKAAAMNDPVAVGMANYQIPPPSARASGIGLAMMRKVMAIDPSYDATLFPARNKTQTDFSAAGASGKAITSADTALAHLDTISQAGKALKSGDVQFLNKIANSIGAQSGSAAPAVYDSIVATVAPEISKAVIGGPGGEGDREKMAANFSRNLSDEQREGSIGANVSLLNARVSKMKDAYQATMGKPMARQLSPESQAVTARYQQGAAAGTQPKAVSTKADYDALPSGATYIDSADGKTYKKR